MTENFYTPAQASAVAKLPLKAVQKIIDVRLIRPRRMRSGRTIRRLLSPEQLVYLRLEAEGVRREVEQELKRLRKVQAMVVSDPEILRGTPVFKGTRIPVELVAEMLTEGATIEDILAGYPVLSREQVELVPLYVAAFPRRGRPAQRPWAKKKPILITRQRRVVA